MLQTQARPRGLCLGLACVWLPALLFGFQPTLLSRTGPDSVPGNFRSPSGRFYAEATRSEGVPNQVPAARFVLHDRDRGVVYANPDFRHATFDISNAGAVVGIDLDAATTGRALLHFYDTLGSELGSTSIGYLATAAFALNGSIYCVNDAISGLRVFSPDGTELYNLGTGGWFAVSADGAQIALARDDAIQLFSQGAAFGRIPLTPDSRSPTPGPRLMTFSPDGTELAFADRRSLNLFRVANPRRLFRYVEDNPALAFTSVDIAPDNPVVAAALDEDAGPGLPGRHTRGLVYLFDSSGRRFWQQELSYTKWQASTPEVYFTGDRMFRVRTAEAVFEYRY